VPTVAAATLQFYETSIIGLPQRQFFVSFYHVSVLMIAFHQHSQTDHIQPHCPINKKVHRVRKSSLIKRANIV